MPDIKDIQSSFNNYLLRGEKPVETTDQPYIMEHSDKSQYDEGFVPDRYADDPNSNEKNLGYYRGEKQPWYDKAANGVVNLAGRALTSGAEGILNPFIGTFYALADGKLSSFIDNPFTRLADDVDKQIKEAVPFYSTRAEESAHGLEKLLYGNTYFRDVLDGVGFTLGAMATGSVYNKLISAIGESALIGKAGEYVNKLNTIENSTDKVQYIINQNTLRAIKDGSKRGLVAGFTASAEAEQQARGDKDQFVQYQLAKIKAAGREPSQEELAKIEDMGNDLALHSYAFNMPVISLDNYIVFGKALFGNKATDVINLKNLGEGITREAGLDGAYKAAENTFWDKTKPYRKIAEPMLAEGFFQEQTQYAISQGTNDYYNKKYESPEAASFLNSFAKGIYDAYGTKEGWDQGIIGALSGGLTGNVTTLIGKGTGAYKKSSNVVPDDLQKLSTLKQYKDLVSMINRHSNIVQDQKNAVNNNDTFSYENSKNDGFINYVYTKLKYERGEDLLDELKQFSSMSEVEFKSNFGNELSKDEISQTKQSVSEFVNDKIDKVKKIQRTFDAVHEKFPNASEANKERLAYSSLTIDNAKSRKQALNKEINELIRKNAPSNESLVLLGNNYLHTSKEGRESYIEALNKSNINPLDIEGIKSKISDINKLEERENQFVKEYHALTKEDYQNKLDKADKKVEAKVTQTNTPKENPFDSHTSTTQETPVDTESELTQEQASSMGMDFGNTPKTDWHSLINNAQGEKELNAVQDQIIKSGEDSVELSNAIGKKREFLNKQKEFNTKYNSLNEKSTTDELKSVGNDLNTNYKEHYKEEHISHLRELYNNAKNREDVAKSQTPTRKSEKTSLFFFNRFAGTSAHPVDIDATRLLSSINLSNPKHLEKLILTINPYKGPYGHNQEISLHYIKNDGTKMFLGFLIDGTSEKATADVLNIGEKEKSKLFINHLLSLNKSEFTMNELVNSGLINLNLETDGFNILRTPEGRIGVAESTVFEKDASGNVIILDNQSKTKVKGEMGVLNENMSWEDIQKLGETDNSSKWIDPTDQQIAEFDRYSVVLKIGDKVYFVAAQPKQVSEKDFNDALKQAKELSKKYHENHAEGEARLEELKHDQDNTKLNTKFFFAVPDAKKLGIKQVIVDTPPEGGLRVQYTKNDTPHKVYLNHEQLSNISTSEELLKALNHQLKGGDGQEMMSVTELLDDGSEVKSESRLSSKTPDFQFNEKTSIRYKVSQTNAKDAAEVLQSSLDTKNPFTATALRVKFNSIAATQEVKSEPEVILAVRPKGLTVENNPVVEDSDDIINKLSDNTPEELIDLEKANNWLRTHLPSFIRVKDIESILSRLKARGIHFGAFQNAVIYLNTKAERGTEYHEAFHAVFRTLLSDSEIANYLKLTKQERGKATLEEIKNFKEKYTLQDKSNIYVENLIYEEYMADKFMDFVKLKDKAMEDKSIKGWFKLLCKKISDWFKYVFSNKTTLDALYYKIEKGGFKNNNAINNRFGTNDIVNKLLISCKKEGGKFVKCYLSAQKTEDALMNVLVLYGQAINDNSNVEKSLKKKKSQLLDDVITNLANSFRVNETNSAIYDGLSTEKAEEFQNFLQSMLYTFTNADSVYLIKSEINRRYTNITGISSESEEINDKESELGNRWDIDFSSIGGFGNLSKQIRGYMATTPIEDTNEWGMKTYRAVNVAYVYSGLERTLSNTPKNQMMDKLIAFAEFNPDTKAFLDRVKKEVDYNEETKQFNNESYIWKAITNNFNTYKVNSRSILIDDRIEQARNPKTGLIDKSVQKKHSIPRANSRDIDVREVERFHRQFINSYQDSKYQSDILDKVKSIYNKFLSVNQTASITNVNMREEAKNIKNAFSELGFDLSLGYISYSIIANRKSHTKEQERIVTSYKDVVPINKLGGRDNGFLDIVELIKQGKNPFDKESGDDATVKLKQLALANAEFDETIGSSTYQNEEGETVYAYLRGTHSIRKMYELQNPSTRKITTLKQFIKDHPEYSKYEAETYFNIFKVNPLLNDEYADYIFDKNFTIELLGGGRNREEDEGKSFGSMTFRDTIISIYTAFFNSQVRKTITKPDGTKSSLTTALFYPKVLEASSTGYLTPLPIKIYYENGKLSELAEKQLFSYFTQEAERILKIQKEINSNYKGVSKIEGVNYSLKGKSLRGLEFFHFFKLNPQLGDKVKNFIIEQAKNEERKELNFPAELLGEIKEAISKEYNKELEDHISHLKEVNLLTSDRDESGHKTNALIARNNLLPGELFREVFYNDKDGVSKSKLVLIKDELGHAFYNDLFNSWALNNLLDGDIAYSRKDADDYVKRNKGANAATQNYGDGVSYGAILREPVVKSNYSNNNIDIADAQQWESMKWRMKKLFEKGQLPKVVEDILNQIASDDIRGFYDASNYIPENLLDILKENQAMLLSDKDVYYDGETYLKLSSMLLTRQLTSIKVPIGTKGAVQSNAINFRGDKINAHWYIAIPGMEDLHNMLNEMEEKNIDYVGTESTSKGMTQDVGELGSLTPRPHLNLNWGMQHPVPSNKNYGTDGSQKNVLISSETGEKTKELAKEHSNLLAQRVKIASEQAFNILKDNLGNKEYTLKYVIDKFQETLQQSGADINLLELFSKDDRTGLLKHNLNQPISINKFEQLYYAHFTKDVLYSKAPMHTFVLVSSHGINVTIDSRTSQIVHRADINEENYQYLVSRPLKYNNETGVGEIMIPSHFKEFGLKPGDHIPSDLLEFLGIRIPTEDKRSMMKLKVVDFLPTYYGSIMVGPKEIVEFSGADFDVDKMFSRRYEHYIDENGNLQKYDSGNKTIEQRWNEYLIYNLQQNKFVKSLISKYTKDDISFLSYDEFLQDVDNEDNVKSLEKLKALIASKALQQALRESGLPSTLEEFKTKTNSDGEQNLGVINNDLLSKELQIYSSEDNKDIRTEISSNQELKDLANKSDKSKSSIYGINGKMSSKEANDTGKNNIGVAAISNMVFNLLSRNKVKLIKPVKIGEDVFDSFEFRNNDGKRRTSIIAMILAAMTDNAKDRLAAKFNLTTNTLPSALYLISIGVPLKTTMKLIKSDAIKRYTDRISVIGQSAFKSTYEKQNYNESKVFKDIREFLINKFENSKPEREELKIPSGISEDMFNSDEIVDQLAILNFFEKLNKDAQVLRKINTLMQLNKGMKISIAENDEVNNALEELGINSKTFTKKSDKEFKKLNLPFDVRNIFSVRSGYFNELLHQHNQVHNNVSKEFFVTQSALGRTIVDLIRNNVKSTTARSKNTFHKIYRDVLSYLAIQSYRRFLENSNIKDKEMWLKSLSIDNVLGDDAIAKKLGKLKKAYPNNLFLKNITSDKFNILNNTSEEGNIDTITGNSRTRLHPEYVEKILNSFQELYYDKSSRQDAIDIFNYMIIKDGMQFKNNSISRFIATFMYNNMSLNLNNLINDIKQDKISNEKSQELFGLDKADVVEDALARIFLYRENIYDLIPYLSKGMDGAYLDENGNLIIDFWHNFDKSWSTEKKTEFAKNARKQFQANNQVIKPDFDEEVKQAIVADGQVFEEEVKKKTLYKFPIFLNTKDGIFKLVSLNSKSADKSLLELTKNGETISSYYAKYVKVSSFGVKQISNVGISKDEISKIEERKLPKSEKNTSLNTKESSILSPEQDKAITDIFNEHSEQIYSQLGNKTVANNVKIKSWSELKEAKKAITPEGIISTRIPNTNEHFGNPFSHDPAGKAQGLIKTETIKEAVEKYIDWILNDKNDILQKHGKSLQQQSNNLVENINKIKEFLKSKGFGNSEIYLVGGRITNKNLIEDSDLDLILKVEKTPFDNIPIIDKEDNKIYWMQEINKFIHQFGKDIHILQHFNKETPKGEIINKNLTINIKFNNQQIQPERRDWIRKQLKSGELKDKPIFYYKELGEPSHATALDYLINKYNWNNTKEQQDKTIKEEERLIKNSVDLSKDSVLNDISNSLTILNEDKTLSPKEKNSKIKALRELENIVKNKKNLTEKDLGEIRRKFCNI